MLICSFEFNSDALEFTLEEQFFSGSRILISPLPFTLYRTTIKWKKEIVIVLNAATKEHLNKIPQIY